MSSDVSLFLLHGESGCGKSSFLQAGLLPYLDALHQGVIQDDANQPLTSRLRVLALGNIRVIRSGRRPMIELARAVYDHISKLERSGVQFAHKLKEARLKCHSQAQFVAKAAASEWHLLRSLRNLSLAVREKPLLVIDQAEDVVVKNSGKESDETADQKRYFRLLSLLSCGPIDMKLLISIRGEFKSRFDSALEENEADLSRVRTYYLPEISEPGILDAILRPTRTTATGLLSRTPPYGRYRFRYANGLPEMILQDLMETAQKSREAVLPVMQVICDRLYSHRNNKIGGAEITEADYRATGAARAQVGSHLEEKIVQFFLKSGPQHKPDYADQADRWQRLLFQMVELEGGLARAKLRVADDEIMQLADHYKCRQPRRMLRWLTRDDCYILTAVDSDRGSAKAWKLTHDMFAVSLRTWQERESRNEHYADQLRGKSILESALWTSEKLYPTRSKPHPLRFSTINDLIWDHQIALYAEMKGFAGRLGLRIQADRKFDLTVKGVKRIDYHVFLSEKRRAMRHRLVVLPAKLFPQIRSKPWTSVGIPNAYRGFAIIGRKRRDVVSGQTAHRDSGSLKTLAHILANPQTRINAFEEESGHFVRYLLQWAKVSSPDKQIKVTAPLKARFNLALDPMFTALVKDECDFALGTAPSRALAEQAGFEVFADFEALIHVLDEPLRQKANALALHEVWAVDLPPEAEGPLMRLASLLLYTVEYVRSKPEEFVRFLYNEALKATADGAYLLQRQFVRKAVSSCYSYAPSEEYFFEYLTPLSGSHHKHTGKRGPAHIFGQLMQYRAECDSLLAKIASLSQVDLSVREHIERATRHYQIFNYYDACQSLQRVARTLGAE